MHKILIPLGVLLTLGACSKPSEKPIETPINSTAPSSTPDWKERFNTSLTDDQIPAMNIYKFGESSTYVHGLKITITEPSKTGDFTVKLDAPNGWVKEGDLKEDRSQVIASTAGEPKFSCDGPFSEDLLPGTSKTYNCIAEDFGKDSTDYIAVMVADFVIPMWTKTGQPY